MTSLSEYKVAQRQSWAAFAPMEIVTIEPAARLAAFARVERGQRVLDVCTGTGVVAVTAARLGALVGALDLTPELLEVARTSASLAGVRVSFREGDVEELPFPSELFDVVLSQFGHIFAPRPDVALGEMLRVLKPGGVVAFSAWPPESFVGRLLSLTARYQPLPAGVAPPHDWGRPEVVRHLFGRQVRDLEFDRHATRSPALSPAHHRALIERHAACVRGIVERCPPEAVAQFRGECEALAAEHHEDNCVRQDYLLARAVKV